MPVQLTADSISGIATDFDGKPLAGATISMFFGQTGSQQSRETRSDLRGAFSASGLPASRIDLLSASAPGYETTQLRDINLPLGVPLELALARLPGGELTVLIARDSASKPEVYSGLLDLYIMRQTTDAPSTPTMGLAQPGAVRGSFQTVLTQNIPLRDGKYDLGKLQPGVYKAAVHVKGEYAESEPFTVGPGVHAHPVVTIGLRSSLPGAARSKTDQKPVPNALAWAVGERPVVSGLYVSQTAISDQQGRFEIMDLAPGSYTVSVAAAGYTTRTVERVAVTTASGASAPRLFVLSSGQSGLQVSVSDGHGRPVSKAPLVLFSTAGGDAGKTSFGRTDETGGYVFAEVPPGKYALTVTAPDDRTRQKTVDVVVAEQGAKPVQIAFLPLVQVSGTASVGGQPFEGLLLFSLRGAVGAKHPVRTDAIGSFAVELEPGEYVAARAGESGTAIVRVPPVASASIEVSFR